MPTASGELTAAEIAAIAALVTALARQQETLTATAVAAATAPLRLITDVAGWFSSSTSSAYIAKVLKVVQPAQLRMARLTDAYHARVLSIMTGARVNPVGAIDVTKLRRAITAQQAQQIVQALPDDYDFAPSRQMPATTTATTGSGVTLAPQTAARAGAGASTAVVTRATTAVASPQVQQNVDPEQVYGRIFDQARFNVVTRGLPALQIVKAATARAASVAATDVMLASRAQSRHTLRTRGVQRYRRVIRPYAGKGGPVCGLCIVAADRVYSIEDLLPIHDHCRCAVVPVGSVQDPGRTLNDDDLRRLYAAAGGTAAGKLLKVKVSVSEHGELGPVLSYAGHKRRGITEVAAASGVDRAAAARAQLASYEKSIVGLRARVAAGDSSAERALKWQSDKIDELRRTVAA